MSDTASPLSPQEAASLRFQIALHQERNREILRLLHETSAQLEKAAAALIDWLEMDLSLAAAEKAAKKTGQVPPAIFARLLSARTQALHKTMELLNHERDGKNSVAGGAAQGSG